MEVRKRVVRLACAVVALGLMLPGVATAQMDVKYNSGQNIVPVFEGWLRNADGTFTMVFGYMNRNYEESVHFRLGPRTTTRSSPDLPTAGSRRRTPIRDDSSSYSGWSCRRTGERKELVWTVMRNGQTRKAYGTLLPVERLLDGRPRESRPRKQFGRQRGTADDPITNVSTLDPNPRG